MFNPKSKIHNPNSGCTGTRREFLWQSGAGFAGLALASLLDKDGFFTKQGYAAEITPAAPVNPLAPRIAHFPAKAKSVIFLFMYGGPSSMDTWDYKPELQKRDGEEIQIEIRRNSIQKQKLLASHRTTGGPTASSTSTSTSISLRSSRVCMQIPSPTARR
jgi:hypothetical protein